MERPTSTTSSLYLETYILPVCRFEESGGSASIRAFHGTAFFINDSGAFLTARHVVEAGERDVQQKGGFLGLCVRLPSGSKSVACAISAVDHAAPPYDVSVGRVAARFATMLTLADVEAHTWKDIATYGYPATALDVSSTEFWIYGRGFKGYVHREVKRGQLPSGGHPDAFEISFSVPPGLSGAPLFRHTQPRDVVVGVCAGVNRAETVEFLSEEILESGDIRTEKTVRIEQYGIAHDLRPLLNWKPPSFGGLTLQDIASPSVGGAA